MIEHRSQDGAAEDGKPTLFCWCLLAGWCENCYGWVRVAGLCLDPGEKQSTEETMLSKYMLIMIRSLSLALFKPVFFHSEACFVFISVGYCSTQRLWQSGLAPRSRSFKGDLLGAKVLWHVGKVLRFEIGMMSVALRWSTLHSQPLLVNLSAQIFILSLFLFSLKSPACLFNTVKGEPTDTG